MDAVQRVRVMVEGVGATGSGIQEHPEEPLIVFPAPPDVVEHDGLVEAFGLQQTLHHLHGYGVALVRLRGADDGVPV